MSAKNVPDWLVGVWRRRSIQEDGLYDITARFRMGFANPVELPGKFTYPRYPGEKVIPCGPCQT